MKSIVLFLALATQISYGLLYSQVFPDTAWQYVEQSYREGWDSSRMADFRRYIIDSTHITGLMIIHKGKVVFEYGDVIENSYIASCRKSVLSMLYGSYVLDGTIQLEKSIGDLMIDDVEGILPIEKQATIADLISARSGVYHPEGYPGGMQEYAPERGSVEPGSYWLYSNWDFNVAGYIFERETGKNIYDEVERTLAAPLNMQDWDRSLQRKEGDTTISKYLAYPMWFSTRDMARIGLLMLQRGQWENRQIIDEEWIDEMVFPRTTAQEVDNNVPFLRDTGIGLGYGYMWWLWEYPQDGRFRGAYSALGAMGQSITVYPEIDVVVAYKTKAAYRRVNNIRVRMDLLRMAAAIYEYE